MGFPFVTIGFKSFVRIFVLTAIATLLTVASKQAFADTKTASASALMLAPVATPIEGARRVKVLTDFLAAYNSNLTPFAQDFVDSADAYHIDWRLLVAISGVESTFGEFQPVNCYNDWGFGIHGNQTRCFTSYPQAIDTISKSIRQDYINKWGATDVYSIGRLYAASPTWASRVSYFMSKIDDAAVKSRTDDLTLSL